LTISSETTFDKDLSRLSDLESILWRQAERVSARAKAQGIAGKTIVLKLKTADFRLRTRSASLEAPTQLADRIFRTGLSLLAKETDGTKFRLIGIGVSDLRDADLADPPDLVDRQAERRAAAEAAMDKLRDKFGKGSVETGYTFGTRK